MSSSKQREERHSRPANEEVDAKQHQLDGALTTDALLANKFLDKVRARKSRYRVRLRPRVPELLEDLLEDLDRATKEATVCKDLCTNPEKKRVAELAAEFKTRRGRQKPARLRKWSGKKRRTYEDLARR